MKWTTLLCALLLGLATVNGAQQSTDKTSANPSTQSSEAELVRLTHEWIDAINSKDRSRLEQLMSPQFVLHGWDGRWQVERPLWLENLFHSIDIQAYSHSDITAQVYGAVGAVTSKWYWRGVRGNAKKKPFEEHGYVVDIWQHGGGHWQVVSRTTVISPGKEPTPAQ
ncbi:MAG: nuclear transport factor 2 family protein [Acidobacteria bacterium]|nr:nuclear transport factor 2 family protein [Acidobacteriota bacterium]